MRSLLTFFSWGQSAGSVSVSLQMLTNGGDAEGLFRAAFYEKLKAAVNNTPSLFSYQVRGLLPYSSEFRSGY